MHRGPQRGPWCAGHPSAELEQIKRDREEVERTMNSPIVIGLFSHLEKRWERAKQAKEVHQRHLLENLRQFIGQYDPEELAAIRETGGSEIFMLLTQVKCRAASAWLKDVLLPGGTDRAWRAEPTPIPEVPPDIVAQLLSSRVSLGLGQIMFLIDAVVVALAGIAFGPALALRSDSPPPLRLLPAWLWQLLQFSVEALAR